MIIHTAIIDQDPVLLSELKQLLGLFCPEVVIVAEYQSLSAAILGIEGIHFDLLFIQYCPEDYDDSDVKSAFPECDFFIIWLAGTEKSAFQLPDDMLHDSLMSPVSAKELRLLVTKTVEELVVKRCSKTAACSHHPGHDRLVISEKRSILILLIHDILYFQSDGNYTKIFFIKNNCIAESVMVSKNLLYFEKKVSSFDFIRIHQSILVNREKIMRIEKLTGEVELHEGTRLPIARDRKKDLFLKLLC